MMEITAENLLPAEAFIPRVGIVARSRPTTLGLSLLEVMIAMTILAVSMMGVLGWVSGLHSMRQASLRDAQIQALAQGILARIEASDTATLGVTGTPWSLPRWTDAPVGNPPLQADAASAQDDLIATGLMSVRPRAENLRVFIEYYVGARIAPTASTGGILDDPRFINETRPQVFNSFINSAGVRNNAQYRLDLASAPATQLNQYDTLLIRIVITWGPRSGGAVPISLLTNDEKIELYTAKRMD